MQIGHVLQVLEDRRQGRIRGRARPKRNIEIKTPVKTPSPLRGTVQRWSTHGISFHRTRTEAIRHDVTGDAQRGLVEPQLVHLRDGRPVAGQIIRLSHGEPMELAAS